MSTTITMTTKRVIAVDTMSTTMTTTRIIAVETMSTTMTTRMVIAVETMSTTMTMKRVTAAVAVITSWGVETHKKFTENALNAALLALDSGRFGFVLRAKGIVPNAEGGWIHFDYVPGECNVRLGSAAVTGKLCVIGANLDEQGVAAAFGV